MDSWSGEMDVWTRGVSLKDRRRSVDLYHLPGVQSVADV